MPLLFLVPTQPWIVRGHRSNSERVSVWATILCDEVVLDLTARRIVDSSVPYSLRPFRPWLDFLKSLTYSPLSVTWYNSSLVSHISLRSLSLTKSNRIAVSPANISCKGERIITLWESRYRAESDRIWGSRVAMARQTVLVYIGWSYSLSFHFIYLHCLYPHPWMWVIDLRAVDKRLTR